MNKKLVIYNTFTGKKEEFKPINPGKIGIYVCGMTVYDYCHLGHARAVLAFDVIVRYLRQLGFDVTYVRNITDVDDKIIKRANENGETSDELTTRFINIMWEDLAALSILPPDQEPRATEHMQEIIALIEDLLAKGYAYVGSNGDVFYSVDKFADYGKLANKDLAALQVGARVDIEAAKQNPMDFVLWKMAKPDEPSWQSPWGAGRPGWHIECSAMSMQALGKNFDIHGGGPDLVFPHHENEIAQSEASTGCKFANYWMHAGTLLVDEQKMSKSLGNFFTIRDALKNYPAEVIRYFMISSHYRSPLNYIPDSLSQAQASLTRLYTALRGFPIRVGDDIELSRVDQNYQERFDTAMHDDFNTPEALVVLFDLAHEINRVNETDKKLAAQLAIKLRQLASHLGLLEHDADAFLHGSTRLDEAERIEQLIAARNQARKNKQWAEADKLRDQLTQMGITLEDTAAGTLWRRES